MRASAITLLLIGLLASSFGCGSAVTGSTGGTGGAPGTTSSSTGSTGGTGGAPGTTSSSSGTGGAPCIPVDDQNPCTDDVCANGLPVHQATAVGTAVPVQIAGDCKKNVCDGLGATLAQNDDADLPFDDGNPCTDEACTAGVPGHLASVNGVACTDGDACTIIDTCQAGTCIGGNPLVCGAGMTCIAGACVTPCSGTVGLPGAPIPQGGTLHSSVAASDLNGDGKPDLAVVNGSEDTVSVLISNGNGTFAAKVDYPTGLNPYAVAAADLNGDGKPDLAVANAGANAGGNTLGVLLNTGNGTFMAQMDYLTGLYPTGIATADLNSDGVPDVVVANSHDNTVSALLNTCLP
jgi:VCBS repeat protein